MPLSMARPGERVRIREVKGGRGIAGKLADMGLYPGVEIVVVSSSPGPLILNRGGARVGLGYGMAQRIIVSPIV
jgi:Fe2+ transport system protein FeoA